MDQPLLYTDLAGWFHLLTPPADYTEEAAFYLEELRRAARRPVRTVLELGSGGGNNASHMKGHVELTLVDISPPMLEESRRLNPECEHHVGDMRSVRLGRTFDAVFVHDAVSYITRRDDLAMVMATVAAHCSPGGAALLAPDYVTETFRSGTEHGGSGDRRRRLTYEARTFDPDPTDEQFVTEMTYRLEEEGEPDRVVHDLHREGLFPRAVWVELLHAAGFEVDTVPFTDPDAPPGSVVFVGVRRG